MVTYPPPLLVLFTSKYFKTFYFSCSRNIRRSCGKDFLNFIWHRLKDGTTLSLDRFYEENNLEFDEPTDDKTEIILALATLEDLIAKLNSINPIYSSVIKMLYDGLSQRAIAAALGKPNSTTQDLIRKTRLEAQRIVSREDLYR